MMLAARLSMVVLLVAAAAACGPRPIKLGSDWRLPEPSGPEDSLIVGQLTIGKDEAFVPQTVRIYRKGKVYAGMGQAGLGEKHFIFDDGRFVAIVKPGTFHFNAFYANDTVYVVATDPKKIDWFDVGAGKVLYLGSFQAVLTRADRFWRPGEFSLDRVGKPGKKELLQWAVRISEGTGWEQRVRKAAR